MRSSELPMTDHGRQAMATAVLGGIGISAALVCGLGYWGYCLIARGTDNAPIVLAMQEAFEVHSSGHETAKIEVEIPRIQIGVVSVENGRNVIDAEPSIRVDVAEADAPVAPLLNVGPVVEPAASAPQVHHLVQLGTFTKRDAAQQEWSRLASLYEDIFADKDAVIEQALSGGETFYRLRADGFASHGETRALCAELISRDADCITVTRPEITGEG